MVAVIMIFLFALMFFVLAICAYSMISKFRRKAWIDMDVAAQEMRGQLGTAAYKRNWRQFGAEKRQPVDGPAPGPGRALRIGRPLVGEADLRLGWAYKYESTPNMKVDQKPEQGSENGPANMPRYGRFVEISSRSIFPSRSTRLAEANRSNILSHITPLGIFLANI